jgi:hypothetical protein
VATATAIIPPSEHPLTPAHYRELTLVQTQTRIVRKAAWVANFNGWSTGVAAALSAPFALFSVVGFLATVGLSVVAYNEFRGRKRLLDSDPSAAELLGWNQIGLLALIAGYSLWMLRASLTEASSLSAELNASQLGDAFGSLTNVEELSRRIAIAFYGTVVAASAVVQGLNALYYFSRRKHIEACLRDAPAWALDLERRTANVWAGFSRWPRHASGKTAMATHAD